MSIQFSQLSRRMFLRAASGATLAVPTLASLLPRVARAQTAGPQRIMFLTLRHFTPAQQWLDAALATRPIGTDGAQEVMLSTLASPNLPVLSHTLYGSLRSRDQIGMLYGLDNMVDTSGHGGLGPSTLSGSLEYQNNIYYPAGLYPSIDTVMEASPTLYPVSTPPQTVKVLRSDPSELIDPAFIQSFARVGGTVTSVQGFGDPLQFYNNVFAALVTPPAADAGTGGPDGGSPPVDRSPALKKSVLDRVHAAYLEARNNRRISAGDKSRLDEHMQMIADLQSQIAASTSTDGGTPMNAPLACSKPPAPVYDGTYAQAVQQTLKLTALAMRCGLSKVGVFSAGGHNDLGLPGLPATGYHNGVVHSAMPPAQKSGYYVVYAKFHLDALADNFLSLLDVEEGSSGRTYLDNMLTVYTHEHGFVTPAQNDGHPNVGHMVVTFGSMGGLVRSGRLIVMPQKSGCGLPYNGMLLTYLQLLGIPKAEYEAINGGPGFGPYAAAGQTAVPAPYSTVWANRLYTPVSELLA